MEKIITKKVRVSKFKTSGVIKIQDKLLTKHIGKKLTIKVTE